MDSAEIYLSLLRPGMGPSPVGAPVIGEAVCNGFEGQIEISTWDWKLHTPEEARDTSGGGTGGAATAGAAAGGAASVTSKVNTAQNKANQKVSSLTREMTELTSKAKWDALAPGVRERKIRDFFEKQAKLEVGQARDQAQAEQRAAGAADGGGDQAGGGQTNRNYEFTFSKRVDIATTQMLNSMKAGDIFPTGVLTVHQRSSNAGLSLVVTVQKVRLTDYTLKVDTTETMTDMTEEWTARFEALAYVYKNRRTIDKTEDIGQAAAKVASQGTVRVFTMKNIGLPF
ncbi:MAG: type VI secretion system tube protein Hcp [Piscinibacter sp.]|nr:type VI secretion system tube protein Hcp [Piscinibacter sp.]